MVVLALVGLATLPVLSQQQNEEQLPTSSDSADPGGCILCHGESDLWEGDRRWLYVNPEDFAHDAHFQRGVFCHDCHGGDPASTNFATAHSLEGGFQPLSSIVDATEFCGQCHKEQLIDVRKSVHAKAGAKNALGVGTLMKCATCHGEQAHGMLPVKDNASPLFLENQVQLCGDCHEKYRETYDQSVHGHGLRESGLLVTAVCADCHGAHDIYYAADRRSTLHPTNVAGTCGSCHQFVEERLAQSVHAPTTDLAALTDELATKKPSQRKPSCNDCHQGHDQPHPDSPYFRSQLPYRCGNCHPEISERYRLSLHGELTQLGYEPAAKCSDCHGSHDILPVANPRSGVAAENRVETCRQCHPNAGAEFAKFDPHASYKDKENYPGLYSIVHWLEFGLLLIFGVFMIHALSWLIRSTLQTLIYGRHRRLAESELAIKRPDVGPRITYISLLISFPGLALTGLPLKYSAEPWASKVASTLGGFESTRIWHHFFAVVVIVGCLAHVWWGIGRIVKARIKKQSWKQIVFGPDSCVPRNRDGLDLWSMIRWFLGLGPKPGFERWTYWEKGDYWLTYVAVAIVAVSGLILWQPEFFSRLLSGAALNVAKVVHSEIALMAASFIFGIHLFTMHMRPEKFPVDLSAFNGLVSEKHLRSARPDYVERLEREVRLEEMRCAAPSKWRLWVVGLSAMAVLLVGLMILLVVIMAQLGK